MKITDVTLTLFAWESIPSTTYGHHSARPTGKSDLGLLRVVTDEGIEGHAFLGTSSNPASLDGPGLIRFLKPLVIGQDPLDRERLNQLPWARARVATVRAIGAVDIALWDIAGKMAGLPIHRLIGTSRDRIAAYASSEIHARPRPMSRRHGTTNDRLARLQDPPAATLARGHPGLRGGAQSGRRRLHAHAQFDLELPLRGGAAGRPGDPGDGVLLVRGPAAEQDIYNYVKLRQKLDIPILATEYPTAGSIHTSRGSPNARPTFCGATWRSRAGSPRW